jgi:hypothetical protein
MVDVKHAVQIANEKAVEILGVAGSLEEIQREDYNVRDAWSLTLGFPRAFDDLPPIARVSGDPLK